MNKLNGLRLLEYMGLPTIKLLRIEDLNSNNLSVSVRLSSKDYYYKNVSLPSIHFCNDIKYIYEFKKLYEKEYDIIIHETVKFNLIGSVYVCKDNEIKKIAIEFYESFSDRNNSNSGFYLSLLNKSKISINRIGNLNYNFIKELLYYINKVPIDNFSLEFVYLDNKLTITDFLSDINDNIVFLKKI